MVKLIIYNVVTGTKTSSFFRHQYLSKSFCLLFEEKSLINEHNFINKGKLFPPSSRLFHYVNDIDIFTENVPSNFLYFSKSVLQNGGWQTFNIRAQINANMWKNGTNFQCLVCVGIWKNLNWMPSKVRTNGEAYLLVYFEHNSS